MFHCNYYGGAEQIRTADLYLTKIVHYLCATEPAPGNKVMPVRTSVLPPTFALGGGPGEGNRTLNPLGRGF